MTTMMISNLPRDLLEEIISRVPFKSMKAVRLTCKTWKTLAKSKVTTPTREGETMTIMVLPQKLYLMSSVVDFDASIQIQGQISFLEKQVTISRIRHYEGLLLCILKDKTRVVVWNPYWGQTRWINLRYSHSPHGHDRFSYALGYEDKESCRSFKLLRFLDYFYHADGFFWYEIYDFDSGLWTTLDVTPYWGIYCSSGSVSIKGKAYWNAKKRSLKSRTDYIICFDFTRERFGPLLPMPSSVKDRYIYVTLSCVKEENIAALFQHHEPYDYEFEIWITTKIEVEMVSWIKFLRMDRSPKIGRPYSLFIDVEKKVFMSSCRKCLNENDSYYPVKTSISIIGEAGYLKNFDVGEHLDIHCNQDDIVCVPYVPSLVQIKKHARGNRIEQISLENRRFDQNKLRLTSLEKSRSKMIYG
ncbi:hypothetical protein CARUB_v10003673mg [Capsella rubella]|uniref:F-box domain-containing protein n=1 Tax=Capsella rubella TaxID=81985 RepID=R0FKC7_9BRAS|nr:putative F-box protein At5g41510 [Capsella rubella]EOA22937.1 hypothetical protein CARUB_v10003673mg [Capsella rubella]